MVDGLTKVNQKEHSTTVQHMGFGKKLIKEAESIAWDYGYHNIAIISAVGTREYYKKQGYHLKNTYMIKKLSNPHPILDTCIIILIFSVTYQFLFLFFLSLGSRSCASFQWESNNCFSQEQEN